MKIPSFLGRRFWILVVNRSRALVYQRYRPADEFHLLHSLDNPEGRLRARQIQSDRPGRTSRVSIPIRNGYSQAFGAEEHLAAQFAQRVADLVEEGRANDSFDWVIVVAGPKMLGIVKNHLDPVTSKRVYKTFNLDMLYLSEKDIYLRLNEMMKEVDRSFDFRIAG